jgi:hypothetical protein
MYGLVRWLVTRKLAPADPAARERYFRLWAFVVGPLLIAVWLVWRLTASPR